MKRLYTVLGSIAVLTFSSPTFAADYINEIEEFVIVPCFLEIFKRNGGDKHLNSETKPLLVQMAKQSNGSKRLKRTLIPLVKGKELAERKLYYDISLLNCIRGSKDTAN